MKDIRIICINDFHAELRETEATPGCAKYVSAVRQYLNKYPDTLVLFGGDNYKGDPISEYSDGLPVTALMQQLGTAASVVGNHEFDFTMDTLEKWQKAGDYQFLAANLVDSVSGKAPSFVKPYCIAEKSGLKIAVIGLATKENLDTSTHPSDIRHLEITDGLEAVKHWFTYLQDGNDPSGIPDAVIALTHFGLKYDPDGEVIGDEMLALCRSGIPIHGAFAAHWHQFMALEISGVPVAQGGSRGQGFAVLTLSFDDDRSLASVKPSYVNIVPEIPALVADEQIQGVYEESYQTAMQELGEVLGTAPQALTHRDPQTNEAPYEGTELSELALRSMMNYTDQTIALFYSGWIGSGLRAGPITKYDLCQLLRFNGGVVTMKVSGAILLKNLSIGIRNLRGESLSPLAVAGLKLTIAPHQPPEKRLVHAELDSGEPILPDKIYDIAVDSSLAEDVMGFDFSKATDRNYPEASIRELMEGEIRKLGVVVLPKPNNIKTV